MPYRLGKQNGKFCVFNKDTGENKGCSGDLKTAKAHMRALYAAESGDKMGKKELDLLVEKALNEFVESEGTEVFAVWDGEAEQDSVTKDYGYVSEYPPYYGATSYAQIDEIQNAEERSAEITTLVHRFPMLAMNVLNSPDIEDKEKGISDLASELSSRVASETKERLLMDLGVEVGEDFDPDELAQEIIKAISKRSDVSTADRKRAVAEYGNVTYADPKNKKYPIDTEEHIRAAWNYINKPKNAAKYSSSEVSAIKKRIVAAWKRKIDKAGPPSAKKEGWAERVLLTVKEALDSLFDADDKDGQDDLKESGSENKFMIWKELDGQWRWLARYSNNFRDRDNPPEIISAASHQRFVERVDKGLAPYPELWLWHVPNWKLGKATWLAYDDSGFALAAGVFNKGLEQVAEWLSTKENVLVSHGMPPETIRRDPSDASIIIEHESREISPLPSWAAANELTGFVSFNKEATMAIPDAKKKSLLEDWKMPPDFIAKIESLNVNTKEQAKDAGLESKEKTGDDPETQDTENKDVQTETSEATTEVETSESSQVNPEYVTRADMQAFREEIAEAIVNTFNPLVDGLQGEIKGLHDVIAEQANTIKELQATDEAKIEKSVASTPAASISAMIARRVIGNDEASVDGRSSLAKSKPKEAAQASDSPIGIPFIDKMLTQKGA